MSLENNAASGAAELDSLTPDVIGRLLGRCEDARFKQLMTVLVQHLHQFIREVGLTEHEWLSGIRFLTETGLTCSETRQEFILLSDTLGASILTILLNQAKLSATSPGALASTQSTVQGPYYWENAPELPLGTDIGENVPGEPTLYRGRVLDPYGTPIAGALIDVWSGDGEGTYDMQMPGQKSMLARGKFRTDETGQYRFWSIKPSSYPIPTDGPVGAMIRKSGAAWHRPGHIHMKLSAPGFVPITTSLFVAGGDHLGSDAVFGDLRELTIEFSKEPPGIAPDGRTMASDYHLATHDFVLAARRDAAE